MLDSNPLLDTPSPSKHPYLSGNFAPVQTCFPLTPCSYKGSIPIDLAGGQYVRNGGNPVINNDESARESHWFDGDGMLSGVLFRRVAATDEGGDGDETDTIIQPEFVNQYLLTDVYRFARANHHWMRRPFMPSISALLDPCTSAVRVLSKVLRTVAMVIFSWLPGWSKTKVKRISVANTSVLYHDGRALATCESGPPLRFILPSLETVGWFNGTTDNEPSGDYEKIDGAGAAGFGGKGMLSFMREWMTAHPRVDPETGELIAFHSFSVKPYVSYSIIQPYGVSTSPRLMSVPVPGMACPKMMHDFGVSRRHTVIMDMPLSLNPLNLFKGKAILSYNRAGKARFGIFPRYHPERVQWFETNACCIFHAANCWDTISKEEDLNACKGERLATTVNLLVCRMTSASLIFNTGNLPTPVSKTPIPPEYHEEEQCRLYYYSFSLTPRNQRILHQFALSAIPFEFPTLSPAHTMTQTRYIYGCTTTSPSASYTSALGKSVKIDALAKIDVSTLIARGAAPDNPSPPEPIKGCVDTRSVSDILTFSSSSPSLAEDDPIKVFTFPPNHYAQEARFVPRKNGVAEDDGWLLTYVFDESQIDEESGECSEGAKSDLWIIDAKGMREVVARIRLPQRVPYGFHGTWFSEEEVLGQRGDGSMSQPLEVLQVTAV
ncbi:retinal pigment epithelial membrane protein [Neurospora tetraspora]|uniref:Retinal pigment epithelial membrane protein n=1 Tax=Neurospora tetraspora TaxID=94610 RepID=A0AAE0JQY9_9PEZI|nr:retinal pigment epithelial membrane protein [Neurospora tetraspora]